MIKKKEEEEEAGWLSLQLSPRNGYKDERTLLSPYLPSSSFLCLYYSFLSLLVNLTLYYSFLLSNT